jgi:hypothetical protein
MTCITTLKGTLESAMLQQLIRSKVHHRGLSQVARDHGPSGQLTPAQVPPYSFWVKKEGGKNTSSVLSRLLGAGMQRQGKKMSTWALNFIT